MLTNLDLKKILPHRYPFLLIDKILELEPGKKTVALKYVTNNEPFFQNDSEKGRVMPGVLIVEALAQTACIAALTLPENEGKLGLFTSIETIEFCQPVRPGNVLRLETGMYFCHRGICKVTALATVENVTVVKGKLGFFLTEAEK